MPLTMDGATRGRTADLGRAGTAFGRLVLFVALVACPPLRVAAAATRTEAPAAVVVLGDDDVPFEELARRDAAARLALAEGGVVTLAPEDLATRAAPRGGTEAPRTEELATHLAACEAARAAYEELDLRAAVTGYTSALAAIEAHPEWLVTAPDVGPAIVDHTLRFAWAALQLQQEGTADAALAALAHRDPMRTPDALAHPEELVQRYLAVRAVAVASMAPLVVAVRPARPGDTCRVLVDGQPFGTAAGRERASGAVTAGRHHVQTECGGAWSAVKVVDVAPAGGALLLAPGVDARLHVTEFGLARLAIGPLALHELTDAAAALATTLGTSRIAFGGVEGAAVRLFVVADGTAREIAVQAPVAPPAPSVPPRRGPVWAYVALGVGVPLVAVGAGFHYAAADETERIGAGEDRLAARRRDIAVMATGYAVGGAALVAAALLFVFEGDDPVQEPGTVRASLAPAGAGAMADLRF